MNTTPDPATQTILIVDDSESAVQSIQALLIPLGHRILIARNGEQALDLARNEAPDMMLLDVMMPGMNGFEVCQAIRADPDTQDLPVVMVTALQDRESRRGDVAPLPDGGEPLRTERPRDNKVLVYRRQTANEGRRRGHY